MLGASVIFSITGSLAAQVNFYSIGNLPGGGLHSEVRDAILTTDGVLAVGTASRFGDGGDTPVKWTPSGGLVPLASDFPLNPSASFITARVIGLDGAVIGGSTRQAATGNSRTPCLWTNYGATLVRLGFLDGVTSNLNFGINGLSADASIAYGWTASASGLFTPIRYTSGGGMVALGYLRAPDNTSIPASHAVSSDGTVMAGNSYNTFDAPGLFAYRYDYTGSGPTGGIMTALPALPGGTWTFAFAMSADGTKIFGRGDSPAFPNGELIGWNLDAPPQALGSPDPSLHIGQFGGALADGSVVAMDFYDSFPEDLGDYRSFIRNPSGWFDVASILADAGVDISGWSLDVLGMSSDGLLLYGAGLHNGSSEGWIIQFPPGYLRAYGDNVPPVISSLTVSPGNLWPANHKMVGVTVAVTASDAVSTTTARIVSITSNEPDNGLGDGDTADDSVITGDLTASLRAERSGKGDGRVYTITVAVSDAAGNTSTGTVAVTVPKNQGGK